MDKPFNPVRKTVSNILLLPAVLAIAAVITAVFVALFSLGGDTPHEASFGDVGSGLLFVGIAGILLLAAIIFWLYKVTGSIVRYRSHRKFFWVNLLVLLAPFLVIACMAGINAHKEDMLTDEIKAVTVNVDCKEIQLFHGGEQILGYHQVADTVYLVTSICQPDSSVHTPFTFSYRGKDYRGNTVVEKANDLGNKFTAGCSVPLGSLKYYAFYNDSLYAGINKNAIVENDYFLQVEHKEWINPPRGQAAQYDVLDWEVIVKPELFGCKYIQMAQYRGKPTRLYVKDTCDSSSITGYPELHGFNMPQSWKQPWRCFTADANGNLFTQVIQSIPATNKPHEMEYLRIAHFNKNKARVYNLRRTYEDLGPFSLGREFCGIFRLKNKLYIIGQQGFLYFELPGT